MNSLLLAIVILGQTGDSSGNSYYGNLIADGQLYYAQMRQAEDPAVKRQYYHKYMDVKRQVDHIRGMLYKQQSATKVRYYQPYQPTLIDYAQSYAVQRGMSMMNGYNPINYGYGVSYRVRTQI